MKLINFMLDLKIIIFIKAIFILQILESNNNGEPFSTIKHLSQKFQCIQVNQWVTARETSEFLQICLSWCFQLQWTGLWNYGIRRMNKKIHQFSHLKAVRNTFTMCNGRQSILQFLLQSTEMAILIFGI